MHMHLRTFSTTTNHHHLVLRRLASQPTSKPLDGHVGRARRRKRMRRKKLLRANRHGGCAAAGAQVPALVAALDAHARHWRGLLACAFPLRAVLEARPVRVVKASRSSPRRSDFSADSSLRLARRRSERSSRPRCRSGLAAAATALRARTARNLPSSEPACLEICSAEGSGSSNAEGKRGLWQPVARGPVGGGS